MRRMLVVGATLALAVTTMGPALVSGATKWVPTPSDRFQIILSKAPSTAQLRGHFDVIETDGFETSAKTVAAVHALGKRAVCYIDVGTWENWRPDAKKFPASVLGKPDAGWPGERWLDIRKIGILLPIMKARFARCMAKGFNAVDPDNVNGVENATGFALTVAAQLAYDRAIASLAHQDGLAVALKSYPDAARALEGSFDFVVDEQCVQYLECVKFAPFIAAKKAVFDIEYTTSLSFCAKLPVGVFGLAKHLSLDGWVRWCP
jgi:hypothetical protein